MEYAIWSACERFGILPPGIKSSWDENNFWGWSQLIAYNQIRILEDNPPVKK